MRARVLFSLLLFATLLVDGPARAYTPVPLRGHVTDLTGTLTAAERHDLEARMDSLDRSSGLAMAALLLPTLGDETIEDVAYDTFNAWGLGTHGLDNGVLLVVAIAERQTRIETGKGIEGALTDQQTLDILEQKVGPALAQERFHDAIRAGVEAIAATVAGSVVSERHARRASVRWSWRDVARTAGWALLLLVCYPYVLWSLGRFLPARRRGLPRSDEDGGGSAGGGFSGDGGSSSGGGSSSHY